MNLKFVSSIATFGLLVSSLATVALPSSATPTTFDVAQQQLSFNVAKERTAPGGNLSDLFDQTVPNAPSPRPHLGDGAAVGHSIDYYNVVTLAGTTQIDARLTVVAQRGMESGGGAADGKVERVDDYTSTAANNTRIRSELTFDQGIGDEWVEYKIEFFTNLETNPVTPTAVQLSNVVLSVYDIDSYQYFESTHVATHQLTSDTILTATAPRDGFVRFAETQGISTSGTDSDTISRVTLQLATTSDFTVRLGQNSPTLESSATMTLDFSQGLAWGELPQPPTPVSAPTVPAANFGVSYFISPPFVQGSYVTQDAERVDFNSATAYNQNQAGSGDCGISLTVIRFESANCRVSAAGQYGGAQTTTATPTVGGAGSLYASTVSSTLPVTANFSRPMKYLGFWWSAGSASNAVEFFSGGDLVLRLTTADLFALFGTAPGTGAYNSTGSIQATDGQTYPRHYYWGNPRGYTSTTPTVASTITRDEPFVYVHVFTAGQTSFDRVELTGGGFEFDNFVASDLEQTPAGNLVPVGQIFPTVTFNKNDASATGNMSPQTSSFAANLNYNTFQREGYLFSGWNTQASGQGTPYSNGQQYPFSSAVTLYAQWTQIATVTYDANEGEGTMSPQQSQTAANLTPNEFTRDGFRFAGWNTEADGSGDSFADEDQYDFAASVTLYAQWAPLAVLYTGPVLSNLSTRNLDTCNATTVTVLGQRLGEVTAASVQGRSATLLEVSENRVVLRVPAGLTAGSNLPLVLNSSLGLLSYQAAFNVSEATCSASTVIGYWTQWQASTDTIKFYAKNPVDQGKVQFFVDGREVAWVRAVDATDPKLRVITTDGPMAGVSYLVRTVELNPGKNRFEIRVNGERVWRATYLPQR